MKPFSLLACLLALGPPAPCRAQDPAPAVSLPPGETRLADIGIYHVFWQSYGGEPVSMPPSWTGHFDPETGISYTPWNRVLQREALLIHSPWRVLPGRVWVDYPLVLPEQTPIVLSFGIAMGPDAAVPDRSDGVTFSCHLVRDGSERELMRHHQAEAEWRDYRFDLSEHAGQSVTLRLQVEPGPDRNASWDYSFFGDAGITVGQGGPATGEALERFTGTSSYRTTEAVDRRALSNSPSHGVTPSNLLPGRNTLERTGTTWRFIYTGRDGRLVYTYEPATGTLDDFTVQWEGAPPFQPALGGGALAIADGSEPRAEPRPLRGGQATRVERRGDALEVDWQYDLAGRPVPIAWRFGIRGKALEVSARCPDPVVARFSLGAVGMAPLRKTFNVPYLLGQVAYLPGQGAFVCRYLDWTASHASQCPQGTATYEPRTDGSRNPLRESGYIAVSPAVNEVLPNLPHPPSRYLAELAPLIVLDIWGHHRGTFQGDADRLRELKDNGVDHLAIIQHVWQRYGYDVKLPDHLPANPAYGGDAGLVAFGRAARECGYVWGLHENYIDLYPDAPSYDPSARVLRADGSPSPAWLNRGTGVQSFGLKCNRALGYARKNAPEIHRRFDTTAAYLDVHTCVPPWHQLDHQAGQPKAAMALAKVQSDAELFQFERDTHQGPLFGEGNHHFFWAGRCDGVEAQVAGGEDHTPFLDFDLLKIHPQMVNHGMGYYERWFRRGYQARWGLDAGSVEQLDKYRAMELAYGHAGFVGNRLTHNIQAVAREHHLVHPVQRLYGNARPTAIHYEVNGRFLTAGAALVAGDTSRQRICYESGLTLWVNWRPDPWLLPSAPPPSGRDDRPALPSSAYLTGEAAPTLPQWGFYARGPATEAGTLLREGRVTDFARCPEFLFADVRTWFDQPYLAQEKDIEPRLGSFEYLGGDKVSVTYEWIVGESLQDDYQCFVHGIPVNGAESDGIDFQQDHRLPEPTRRWQPGSVIVDGPHELRVPGQRDAYDLVIGLFKGPRLPLKGVQASGSRILLARLRVERKDGRITGVTARKATPDMAPARVVAADFDKHTNPPGTWVDFGPVATDGAVKINLERDRLVLFPYPRTRSFGVSLDLPALAPEADRTRVRVRALAAGTRNDLGPVDARVIDGQLRFRTLPGGAGRYLVTWPQPANSSLR